MKQYVSKNICSEYTYSFTYNFNVLVDHRDPPQPWTLQYMLLGKYDIYVCTYSHLSNKRAGWNKRVSWKEFHMKKCKQGRRVKNIVYYTQKNQ